MSRRLNLRKVSGFGIFLALCFGITGCFSLKTVPVNKIPAEREILIIHAEDNYWTADRYTVADGILSAHLGTDTLKIRKGKTAHVYVAPVSAVRVDGADLTVPVMNIAKADYHELNVGETFGFGAIWASLLFTLLLFIG